MKPEENLIIVGIDRHMKQVENPRKVSRTSYVQIGTSTYSALGSPAHHTQRNFPHRVQRTNFTHRRFCSLVIVRQLSVGQNVHLLVISDRFHQPCVAVSAPRASFSLNGCGDACSRPIFNNGTLAVKWCY